MLSALFWISLVTPTPSGLGQRKAGWVFLFECGDVQSYPYSSERGSIVVPITAIDKHIHPTIPRGRLPSQEGKTQCYLPTVKNSFSLYHLHTIPLVVETSPSVSCARPSWLAEKFSLPSPPLFNSPLVGYLLHPQTLQCLF